MNIYRKWMLILLFSAMAAGSVSACGKNEGSRTEASPSPSPVSTISPEEAKYQQAKKLLDSGMYQDTADLFKEIAGYEDAMDQYYISEYALGKKYYDNQDYESSKKVFTIISGYQDADEQVIECDYQMAIRLYRSKKYKKAINVFKALASYKKANTYYKNCQKRIAAQSEYFEVNYVVNDSNKDEIGGYYKSGKGKLEFLSDIPLDDWVGFGGKYVTYTMPQSTIKFRFKNRGKKKLKNAKIKLEFEGVFLKQVYNDAFREENHIHGLGGFGGASLKLGTLQPNEAKNYQFEMSEAYFENGKSGNLYIIASADGYKARTYTVPLRLK